MHKHLLRRTLNKNFCTSTASINKVYPERFVNYFLKPNHYNYLDNTKFMENIFDNNFTELILAPENHGKTFNMETLKYFLSSNEFIEEKVTREDRLNFFKKTNLFKESNFFNMHFAKYPVITINLRELDQNDYKDNIEKFKFLVALQFEQVLQFIKGEQKETKDNLTYIDMKNIEEFFSNYKNYSENHLINSCKDLGKFLLKITKQNPFMIIDDYDFPLLNAYKKGYYEETLNFMQNFINVAIKNNNFINKSIITGVNLLEQKRLFSQLNNMTVFNYDQEIGNKYFKYFGEKEISNNLLNTPYEKSQNLHLKSLFQNVINDKRIQGTHGMKVLADLKNKVENFEKSENTNSNSNSNINSNHQFHELSSNILNESIELSNNLSNSSENANNPNYLYTYLHYNGLLTKFYEIKNSFSAQVINQSLPGLENPNDQNLEFNKKLTFAYYAYLMNKRLENYLDYLKNLFEFATIQTKKNKTSLNPLLPENSIVFRSDKDFEDYLIDIMSEDMTSSDSEHIKIFSIDDDDMTKISDQLKKFTLIVYEKQNFAIFLKGSKYKKPVGKENINIINNLNAVNKVEIDEMLNNPNLSHTHHTTTSSVKKSNFIKKAPSVDISQELKKINEQNLASINKQEAINFLWKISSEYDTVFFISMSNYQKQIDYLLEIVKLEKE
jgi:hypothetical protein